jgi:hypothetical protein
MLLVEHLAWSKQCIESRTFMTGVVQVWFTVDYCAAGGFKKLLPS